MSITYQEMCDAVKSVLDDLVPATLNAVQSCNQLTEDYADCPMAQVYVDGGETDVFTAADRTTFRGIGRVTDATVIVDVPCKQRSNIDEDIAAVMRIAEAVQTQLESVRVKPYFNNSAIKGFRWSWQRVTFSRGEGTGTVLYPGLKYTLTLKVF